MPPSDRFLLGLPQGIEAKLMRAVFKQLKADPVLQDFHPWVLLDTPQLDKFLAFGTWSAVVQPMGLAWDDNHTISRQDVKLAVGVSFFLPYETMREDSGLLSLNLGRYLAGLFYSTEYYQDPDIDPAIPTRLNISVTAMRPLQPIPGDKNGYRILTWAVDLLATVDPQTGRDN